VCINYSVTTVRGNKAVDGGYAGVSLRTAEKVKDAIAPAPARKNWACARRSVLPMQVGQCAQSNCKLRHAQSLVCTTTEAIDLSTQE